MNKLQSKLTRKARVQGTAERPRLSANISNRHIIAQIVDDVQGLTLVYTTTAGKEIAGSLSKKAEWAGADIAKKAKKANITKVVFDRGSKIYHGRVKVLAETARKNGLEF